MKKSILTVAAMAFGCMAAAENVSFADEAVKALCVANWDSDEDGELSLEEAAAVESLGNVFRENSSIASFEELKYFTGLSAIGDYAFYKSSLQKVAFPSTVTSIGEYAFSKSAVCGELRIPGTVKEIKNFAFYSCKMLTSVILEEGVEIVGWQSFTGPITTFSLPASLTFMKSMVIDPYVNANPSSGMFFPEGDLWVFSHSTVPPAINEMAFYYVFADGHLVVPFGTVDAYKASESWAHFREYFEQGDVNADGYIDPEDVKLLQQVLDGEDVELKNALLADVNGDGQVDAADMDELNTHFYAEDGTPTMIAETETKEQSVPEGVYTIDGRKVLDDASQIQSLRPGIYISQGRKFVVR